MRTMAKRKKYLSYIEETKKHHPELRKVAKSSTAKAIKKSHAKSVPVTYMEGEEILRVSAKGKKSVVGKVKNDRRKVKVGDKTRISNRKKVRVDEVTF